MEAKLTHSTRQRYEKWNLTEGFNLIYERFENILEKKLKEGIEIKIKQNCGWEYVVKFVNGKLSMRMMGGYGEGYGAPQDIAIVIEKTKLPEYIKSLVRLSTQNVEFNETCTRLGNGPNIYEYDPETHP